MNVWEWPQQTVALWLIIVTAIGVYNCVAKDIQTGIGIIFQAALLTFVLTAGGFWS